MLRTLKPRRIASLKRLHSRSHIETGTIHQVTISGEHDSRSLEVAAASASACSEAERKRSDVLERTRKTKAEGPCHGDGRERVGREPGVDLEKSDPSVSCSTCSFVVVLLGGVHRLLCRYRRPLRLAIRPRHPSENERSTFKRSGILQLPTARSQLGRSGPKRPLAYWTLRLPTGRMQSW